MSEIELCCPICLEDFDTGKRIPFVLACGHTYCKLCLKHMSTKELKCPNDRKPEERPLHLLPKNFIILDFLRSSDQITPGKDVIEKCKEHPAKRTKFYCKTDEIKICSRCLLMHKDHECFELLDYKDEIENKKPKVKVNKPVTVNAPSVRLQSARPILARPQSSRPIMPQLRVLEEERKEDLHNFPAPAQIHEVEEERKEHEYRIPPPMDIRRVRALPYDPRYLEESRIIPYELQIGDVRSFLVPRIYKEKNLVLKYRYTEHGASNDVFHALCDGVGPTVTIVKANGYIFGGFTRIPWETPATHNIGKTKRDDQAFLFSLGNGEGRAPKKLGIIGGFVGLAVYHYKYLGPTFGHSSDLVIDLDQPDRSRSHVEHFKLPRNANPDSYLAGRHSNWNIAEIEVYQVQSY
jgi:hypothetical protein